MRAAPGFLVDAPKVELVESDDPPADAVGSQAPAENPEIMTAVESSGAPDVGLQHDGLKKEDFQVNETVVINRFKFRLLEGDKFSEECTVNLREVLLRLHRGLSAMPQIPF